MTTTPSLPSIATIIVNYGTGDLLLGNLTRIVAEHADFERAHIFIVDNDSPNGDLTLLADYVSDNSLGDRVTVLDAGANLGFAGGNNVGFVRARRAQPDYVFFLNPDAFPRPGALRALTEFLESHSEAAVAGARLENEDGSPRSCFFEFPGFWRELSKESGVGSRFLKRRVPQLEEVTGSQPFEVDWVSGAAFLFRTSACTEDPPMDDNFFLYYEETDMMLNLKRSGWTVWHVPTARVVHVAGAATGVTHDQPSDSRLPSYWFDSWRLYYTKNHGHLGALAMATAKSTGVALYHVKRMIRRQPNAKPQHYAADVLGKCLLPLVIGRGRVARKEG